MRHTIICKGLVVAMLVLTAASVHAEIIGIKDAGECPGWIVSASDLQSKLGNLQAAGAFLQQGRYVFCMTASDNIKYQGQEEVKSPVMLSNPSQYPVVIYNLTANGNLSQLGQPLLTVTGPILLQNLKAENLRGPIVMNGSASMKDSALSCDTSEGNVYANAILELKGSNERVNILTITNCKSGISVAGSSNVLTDVTVTYDKVFVGSVDDGLTGVSLGASNILKASSLGQTIISGYTTAIEMKSSVSELSRSRSINVLSNGAVKMNDFAELSGSSITGTIHVNGNNVLVGSKNTLGGDPAVQIAKGMSGVKVTQNTFTKVNTIAYLDVDDEKAHTLLSAEWVGKRVDDNDPTIVIGIGGKLMDQTNLSNIVEASQKIGNGDLLSYANCSVNPAEKEYEIVKKDDQGNIVGIKKIMPTEKYFYCSFEPKAAVSVNDIMRFVANTPTVSLMSGNNVLKDFGDWITIVAIAESTVTNGGENSPEAPSNPTGDDDPKIPDPTDTGENANGSAQGNGATSDGYALAGETPSGYTAGASPLGSCTLSTVGADQGQTASALVWLLALLPLPLMIPFRNSKKDDK